MARQQAQRSSDNGPDLPVEQLTKFEFIINLKAAKQIGLTIPPNVFAISGELAGKIQISTRILSSVEKGC
jgi:ABC-type uncharacterized transport system substrate-binding protein